MTTDQPAMTIRAFQEGDWPQLWPVIEEIVRAGDTFPYDPAMTEEQGRQAWLESPPGLTVVAVRDGRVLGTAKMGPNRSGPGAHISTASFMVSSQARGQGVGTALCGFAVGWAREHGYAGMQFNAVVETNAAAVHVYEQLGFRVLGTVPRSFRHPVLGEVGLHLMYREFLGER